MLKFEQFCKVYEERLLNEITKTNGILLNNNNNLNNNLNNNINTNTNTSIHTNRNYIQNETDKSSDELLMKRSNTPTPRRAAPIPPSKKPNGSLPNEFFNLTSLKQLSLSGNQLKGSISTYFYLFKNLLTLQIDFNRLTGTIPTSFQPLYQLQTFD